MNIEDLELSVPMKELYNEVSPLINKIEIVYTENDLSYSGVGARAIKLPNRDWEIELRKDEPFMEYVLSHELLHILLDTKGYPNVSKIDISKKRWKIAQLLTNTILHKIIIKKQLKRGFEIEDARKEMLRDVADNWPTIRVLGDYGSFRDLVTLVSFMIEAEDYLDRYIGRIKENNLFLYEHAERIYKEIYDEPYDSPYSTRKRLVRVFKAFDDLLKDNNLPQWKLFEKLSVVYIPSTWELQLSVSQVFDDATNQNNDLFFYAKSDGQLSFAFEIKDVESYKEVEIEINKRRNMTVEGLFNESNTEYVTHN